MQGERLLCVRAVLCLLLLAAADPATDVEVKAAFLSHFPSYVDWPAECFTGPTEPVVVGLYGEDPFGPLLDDLLKERTVGGRPIVARRLSRLEDVGHVHVLYLGTADRMEIANVLAELHHRPVLTVADGEGLAERGVVLSFRLEDRKVRFDINLDAADRADLRLSSQLLKLARIVRTSPDLGP